ncbi:hypothetical protein PVAND_016834 [Polypedilum vanderplanki]|uniref:Leucine rich repeat protein n=1 Tax=Polypedilum vanderplanki TaxID=319348 RepID=A0A9J6BGU0_POLVA|nr:hypothetical protein PVAND_016834 [Polypedilum vanderplanki]
MKEKENVFIERQLIEGFDGTHTYDMLEHDIVGFITTQTKSIKFIPKILMEFSQNFLAFAIENSNLKEVLKDDFMNYPKLQIVSLSNNKIEVIKADTFEENYELESISLEANEISHIEPFTFLHLNKLRFLQMRENNCVNPFDDAITRYEVEKYSTRIDEGECISEKFAAIKIFSLERSLNLKFKEIDEKLKKNEKILNESHKMLSESQNLVVKNERFEEIKKVVADLALMLEKLSENYETMMSNLNKKQ